MTLHTVSPTSKVEELFPHVHYPAKPADLVATVSSLVEFTENLLVKNTCGRVLRTKVAKLRMVVYHLHSAIDILNDLPSLKYRTAVLCQAAAHVELAGIVCRGLWAEAEFWRMRKSVTVAIDAAYRVSKYLDRMVFHAEARDGPIQLTEEDYTRYERIH